MEEANLFEQGCLEFSAVRRLLGVWETRCATNLCFLARVEVNWKLL